MTSNNEGEIDNEGRAMGAQPQHCTISLVTDGTGVWWCGWYAYPRLLMFMASDHVWKVYLGRF
jgi:hypothetical protein